LAVDALVVVGANHRSSTLAVRDRLFIDDDAAPAVFATLRRHGIIQGMAMATCDRVKLHAIDARPEAADILRQVLVASAGLDDMTEGGALYTLRGETAVRHVFAVAASLDSLIIGEPYVLGQIKHSHRLAEASGMAGGELDALMRAAYTAAKRVRSETAIGERPVSIAAAAVGVAESLHGSLDRSGGLIVGSGEMGEIVAEALRAAGIDRLTVMHPKEARAEALARSLSAHVASFDGLEAALETADVVVTSLGTGRYVLDAGMIQRTLR